MAPCNNSVNLPLINRDQNLKTMRKVLLLVFIIPIFVSCNQDIKDENARLKEENLQLRTQNDDFDNQLGEYEKAQKAIEANLDSIRAKEELIQAIRNGDIDGGANAKQRILENIAAIDALLGENRNSIASLNDKVSRYSIENGKFKKQISFFKKQVGQLNESVVQKDSAISNLKGELVKKNFKIEELNSNLITQKRINSSQKDKIELQTRELNTAYYVVGKYSDLKDNKVVEKRGGIIGLGRTKTLAEDFNKDYFTKIDITANKLIPIDSDKKVEIISEHPSDSYKLNMVDDKTVNLEVLDINKFWKASKYLVIMVK